MTTLSARHSGFMKRVFPFAVLAGACAWTFWSKSSRGAAGPLWVYPFTAVVLTTIAVVVLRRDLWIMADTVELSGDALIIRRWTTTERIALADVKSISWAPYFKGSVVVTLELRQSSAFGPVVRFYAPVSRRPPYINTDLESLAARLGSVGGTHVA